ncbi:MAG TPA: hypothetical protein VJ464_19105 [Blastocatellia bacterium]|nr:hypothetical protein [Blastocatellia bacterium]
MRRKIGSLFTEQLAEKVCNLEYALQTLKIDEARVILDDFRQEIEGESRFLSRLKEYAHRVLICFAFATDFEESYRSLLKELAAFCLKELSVETPLIDVARNEIANALIELYEGRYDNAAAKLRNALPVVDRTDANLKSTVRYYLARCYWPKRDYDNGLELLREAKQLDLQIKGSKRLALIETLESYLLFLKDDIQRGSERLAHARGILEETTDRINLAIVRSFQGQFCRRAGDYDGAIEHFEVADRIFRDNDAPDHRKRARCLMNNAVVHRLKALNTTGKEARGYLKKAENYLELAKQIYDICPERFHRNLSKYSYICALIHLDYADIPKGRQAARQAYSLAKRNNDKIAMARARVAQCMIELEKESRSDESAKDARRAYKYALDALNYSEQTQYRRIQARAHIWLGKSLILPPFNNPQKAEEHWKIADDTLASEHKDYLRDELDTLWDEIDRFDGPVAAEEPGREIDALLRTELKGYSLAKMIQELVLAVMRNNEGKSQKEIARILGITPKRLRRILAIIR